MSARREWAVVRAPPRRVRSVARAALLTLAAVVGAGCGSQAGPPGAPSATVQTGQANLDATVIVDATRATVPTVNLRGRVTARGVDAGLPGAFVVVEVGGLGHVDASLGVDGALTPTLAIDPSIRYGAVTNLAGRFAVLVPAGPTGVRALDPAFYEGADVVVLVADAASPDATPEVDIPLDVIDAGDGGPRAHPIRRPVVTGFEAMIPIEGAVEPLSALAFTADVAAGNVDDPLSGDIFILQPDTGFAGGMAPPDAAAPGGAYPDGTYNRVVVAPANPGVYKYTALAVSLHGVPSLPVSVSVTVTASGLPPIPDASVPDTTFFEGGGLPDGRY